MAKTIAKNGGVDILPEEIASKVEVREGEDLATALQNLPYDDLVIGLQEVRKNKPADRKLYELLRENLDVYRAYSDKAMVANVPEDKNLGGIYLNPKLLDMQIKRDGNGVPLPLINQSLKNMKIEGFIPVIINIQPVGNLPLILGLGEGNDDTQNSVISEKSLPKNKVERISFAEVEEANAL